MKNLAKISEAHYDKVKYVLLNDQYRRIIGLDNIIDSQALLKGMDQDQFCVKMSHLRTI